MITITEINNRILALQSLAASDADSAIAENSALFYNLIQRDEFWILPQFPIEREQLELKSFLPYTSKVDPDDPRLFVRIFSHIEAAEQFAESLGGDKSLCCKISSIESLQLAKSSFVLGSYGYILNDGESWAAIGFHDYLRIAFERLLCAPERYNPEYVHLILFLGQVRKNAQNRIICVTITGPDNHQTIVFTRESRLPEFSSSANEAVKLSINSLCSYADSGRADKIVIATDGMFETTPGMLRAALNAAHIKSSGPLTPSEFIDEVEELSDYPKHFDFHVKDIDLDFAPEDTIALDENQALNSAHTTIRQKLSTPSFKNKLFALFTSMHKKIPPMFCLRNPSKIELKIVACCLVAIVIISMTVITLLPGNDVNFQAMISDCNYGKAYSIYTEHLGNNDFTTAADAIVANEIDSVIKAYGSNELSAAECKASLELLSVFPHTEKRIAQAYSEAADLEDSKNSYFAGRSADTIIEKLSLWDNVIPQDSVNYAAVQADFLANKSSYRSAGLLEADKSMAEDSVRTAINQLSTLRVWYPDDAKIAERLDNAKQMTMQDPWAPNEPDTPNISEYPISISAIHTQFHEFNSPWIDLTIQWKNVSAKTISEVRFYVSPEDELNNIMSCKKQGYSSFCARDSAAGPYEPGEGTPDGNWAWTKVWYNSSITHAILQKVEVHFSDGTSTIISVETELAKLLR